MHPHLSQLPALQQALFKRQLFLLQQLSRIHIAQGRLQLFIRVFKVEQQLEVWARQIEDTTWQHFQNYPFCQNSGKLGPKRKEGDRQIPEGVYQIDRFNPKSKYHLSLGLDYPNAADRILGDPNQPGSDIFIHGGCETVGCIPITDPGIEELYILALWARENGQLSIPVHIFPFRFNPDNWKKYQADLSLHHHLWQQLEKIYFVFEQEKILPEVVILPDGAYDLAN